MIRLTGTFAGLQQAVEALRAVAGRLPDAAATLASDAAQETKQALQGAAPVGKPVPGGRTPGGLRKSIGFDLSGTTAEFYASDVAEYVIGGTAAHDIVGSQGPLHFFWEQTGGFVTFMKVRHPGTAPHDFRAPALQEAAGRAEGLLEALGDELAEGFTA